MPKLEDKPIIAVDIDEVLFPMAPTFLEYHNATHGTDLRLSQMASYYVEALTGETYEEMQAKIKAYLDTGHYSLGQPIEGAVDSIHNLKKNYRLAVITSRDHFYRGSTETFLNKHFSDLFDQLHYTHAESSPNLKRPKHEICIEIGAIALVDDHLKYVTKAAAQGVKGLLFGDYPWNQADELPSNVTRVKNWQEVLKYFDGAAKHGI